jgi:predicted nuclease with TOPRIM domain
MGQTEPPNSDGPAEIEAMTRAVQDRLQRLEEVAMQTDNQREHLEGHVLDLTRAIDQLARRVQALEGRLSQIAQGGQEEADGGGSAVESDER